MIVDREAIVRLFRELQDAFPHLRMQLQLQDRHVDLNMDIPPQPGLAFFVNLNLQGDELHLSAGSFWLEWFPCTRPAIVDQYRDAVTGLLSGRYRILEHYIGAWAVRAQLQRPEAEGWQTIGTWANLGAAVPWPRRRRVLQNVAGEGGAA
jgi:hypothetical protein